MRMPKPVMNRIPVPAFYLSTAPIKMPMEIITTPIKSRTVKMEKRDHGRASHHLQPRVPETDNELLFVHSANAREQMINFAIEGS
jgi:hypothetical protein